jgi:pyochelin biosynthetic protein PchC
LTADVGVYGAQYPGRQDRFAEPAADGIEAMAAQIATAAASFVGEPLVLFGHSMGAYVAYEATVELERRHGPVVDLLVVSAVPAPHHKPPGEVHKLPDAEFAAEVARENETFARNLAQTPELVEVLLPMIRDDYRLFELYQPNRPPAVLAALMATGGDDDPGVDRAGLETWKELAAGGFDVLTFPGAHFYLVQNEAALVGAVAARMPPA